MFYLLLQHVQTRYLLTIHHNHIMILVSLLLITSSTYVIMLYSALQASAFFGLLSPIANNNNFLTYLDSVLEIKIDYAVGQTHELHPGSLVTFLASLESDSNTYPAGLGITVQHLGSGNTSLNEVNKVQIKNLTQSHPDFKLTESINSILAGNIAHKIVFSATWWIATRKEDLSSEELGKRAEEYMKKQQKG